MQHHYSSTLDRNTSQYVDAFSQSLWSACTSAQTNVQDNRPLVDHLPEIFTQARMASVLHLNVSSQAFTAWQAHTSHKQEGQEKLRRAVARLQHCLLARAFATLASHTRRSADLRQRLCRAVAAFQNTTLRAAFNAWLEHTQLLQDSRQQVSN